MDPSPEGLVLRRQIGDGKDVGRLLRLPLPRRQWSAKRECLSNCYCSADGGGLSELQQLDQDTVLSLAQICFCPTCLRALALVSLSMTPIQKSSSYFAVLCVAAGWERGRNSSDLARRVQWQMQVCWRTPGKV